jgi:GDP-mannose 6-dehydrogenase
VERRGLRRTGILGLSFKPGTDDVRESPTVSLVETLVGRGYQVSIYDGNVDPDRLVGSNRASLERELPHIAALMRSSIDEVLSDAEIVVIANGDPAFREVLRRVAPEQVLIDLVGLTESDGRGEDYDGICW